MKSGEPSRRSFLVRTLLSVAGAVVGAGAVASLVSAGGVACSPATKYGGVPPERAGYEYGGPATDPEQPDDAGEVPAPEAAPER